ncbi:MAG TPA: sugar transferase [Candidatus Hydrogenedentes bacterium]|nr:sugar transferase [Candidatus Hydrogenedentota bacterium]HPG67166.1 sugar transferase [Candidatus Hydrogenedentota bacterium]
MATADGTAKEHEQAGMPRALAPERVDPSTWAVGWGRGRKRTALVSIQLVGDVVVAGLAIIIAFLMHQSWPPSMNAVHRPPLNTLPLILATVRAPEFSPYLSFLLVSPIVHLLVFDRLRLYRQNLSDVQPFRGVSAALKGALFGTIVLVLLAYGYHTARGPAALPYPPLFFVYEGMLVFFGVTLSHAATLIGTLVLHSFDIGRSRVALVFDDESPLALAEALRSPLVSYNLVGGISIEEQTEASPRGNLKALGTLGDLKALINRHNLDEVILALDPGSLSSEQRLEVAQTCWKMGAQLKMVTPFHPFFHTRTRPEVIGGVSLLHVENIGLYATVPQVLKRAMDLAIATTALIGVSPIMLVVAILIKLDSRGPVFFVQERVGLNGRTFKMIKFRSMQANNDVTIHREYAKKLVQGNQEYGVGEDGKPIYKVADDPRITRVGHVIRKTSIDELPQFINVLRGEMSMVGPRPPIQYEVDEYKDWHLRRLHIRPGLTGLWQVSGRNRLSFEQMVRLDIDYIENWSLWLDVKILLRTVGVVLKLGDTR